MKQLMPKTVAKLRKKYPHLKIDIVHGKKDLFLGSEYGLVIEFKLRSLKMFTKRPTYQHLDELVIQIGYDISEKIREEVNI